MTEAPVIRKLKNPTEPITYSPELNLCSARSFYSCPPYGLILQDFQSLKTFDMHYPLTFNENIFKATSEIIDAVCYHTYSKFGEEEISLVKPRFSSYVSGISINLFLERFKRISKSELRIKTKLKNKDKSSHKHIVPTFKLRVLKDRETNEWNEIPFSVKNKRLEKGTYLFTADLTSLLDSIVNSYEYDNGTRLLNFGSSVEEVPDSASESSISMSMSMSRNCSSCDLLSKFQKEEVRIELYFGYGNSDHLLEWIEDGSSLSLAVYGGELSGGMAVNAICHVLSGITNVLTSESTSFEKITDSSIMTSSAIFDMLSGRKDDLNEFITRPNLKKQVLSKRYESFGNVFNTDIELPAHSISIFDISLTISIEPDIDLKFIRFHGEVNGQNQIASVLPSIKDSHYVIRFQYSVENRLGINESHNFELICFNKSKSTNEFTVLFSSHHLANRIAISSK